MKLSNLRSPEPLGSASRERKTYADVMRLVAMLAIISLHASGSSLHYNAYNDGYAWWVNSLFYDGFLKWGTGVFLMISGVFMLEEQRTQNIRTFLIGRFKRIVIPFIVWAVLYKIYDDPNAIIETKGLVLFKYLKEVITGDVKYHLWFVYMIVALYLIAPVLSFFVNQAPKKIINYYLIFWFSMILIPPYLLEFGGLKLGISQFLELTKYSGFFVLGFVMDKTHISKPWLLVPVFIGLSLMTITGTYYMSVAHGENDYFLLNRMSPINVINAGLIFLFFRSINWDKIFPANSKRKWFLMKYSFLSYGIYLNHIMVLTAISSENFGFKICAYKILDTWVKPIYGVPFLIFVVTIASTLLAFLLSKIPVIRKLMN